MKVDSPTLLQKKIFNAVKEKKDLVINTRTSDKPEIGYLSSLLNEISKTERRQGTRAILLAADPKRAKELDEWIWAVGYHASIESEIGRAHVGTPVTWPYRMPSAACNTKE